jgi:hypothetical protein
MPETDLKRTDYEPYFERWNSVLHFANPAMPKSGLQKIHGHSGDAGSVPCYQHKTCNALVLLGAFGNGKFPPRVCPGCGVDTATEVDNPKPKIEVPNGFRTA